MSWPPHVPFPVPMNLRDQIAPHIPVEVAFTMRRTPRDEKPERIHRNCATCGTLFKSQNFHTRPNRGKFCSVRCYGAALSQKVTDPATFWARAIPEPNSGCWLWDGSQNQLGYGEVSFNGKVRRATHVALDLVGRPVPKGMFALHRCDNPACVNPDHLFHGDAAANMADCRAKGRARGRYSGMTHCTEGHLFPPPNPVTGRRGCKICVSAKAKAKRARLKAEAVHG